MSAWDPVLADVDFDALTADLKAGRISIEEFNAATGIDEELDAMASAARRGWCD